MASAQIDTMHHFSLVAAMNVAFGNPQGELRNFLSEPNTAHRQTPRYNEESWERLTNQCTSIGHEIAEFKNACAARNGYEVRDSLCDIRVFAYGGAHIMGYNMGKENLYDYGLTSHEAIKMEFIFCLEPAPALDAAFSFLMHTISKRQWYEVESALRLMIYAADRASYYLGLTEPFINDDMEAVVNGVMTRFVKDEADFEATAAHHAAYGVSKFYTVGSYPTMAFKSSEDQEDAPKDKFLKSASYQKPVFIAAPGFFFNEPPQIG